MSARRAKLSDLGMHVNNFRNACQEILRMMPKFALPNVRRFRATLRDGKLRENQNCDNIHAPKAKQE